jgi:putative ABC transport system ATP-binding protein
MRLNQPPVSALRGRDLTRSFGDGDTKSVVLHEVSIELATGQVALLMGPSGSGKSTLLATLSGLLSPDSGQVLALGQDLWGMSEKERERFRLRHVGFIFQGYNLFGALNARQQLEMVVRWGENASARDARRRADEMLSLLGLAKKAHLRPGEMSGGEKQRVAIGRALIKDPNFCFADEPTSALDWAHGEQVIELLRNAAHERGAMVLIVGHDARIIPYVDRVFHLEDGFLRESDETTPATVNGTHPARVPSVIE